MPTYDYKCENCNETFEIFQSIKDDPIKLCPNCGKETLKKAVSMPAGLIFKGSGFYLTDYKNAKNASSSKGSKEETSKQPETKTDTNKKSTGNSSKKENIGKTKKENKK